LNLSLFPTYKIGHLINVIGITSGKTLNGLATICKQRLASDHRSGTLFVFINCNKTMVRALIYDDI
jgi:hypothetical protein